MEDTENNIIIQENYFCKSISGEEDENGNYKFEVEASNENLDLQNQITLQSALKKSEKYFVTNGVISDDHLHKTRNPDGSVETHKDKIIGEPISVRFDPATKKTFVKGVLYAGIEAAKPYIDLLKNKSRLVKASIGGIMPKIRKNADGSETVTSFMWNDLALTCSPVNWTVGSAKFAKSMGVVDFCKSLNAGSGSDAANFEGGRVLQNEDIEDETVKLQEISDNGDLAGKNKDDDLEKADDDVEIIKSCVLAIDNGDLITKSDIENYLIGCGFDMDKAIDVSMEIIKQGGIKMVKGNFSSTIDELLKSFKEDSEKDDKKKKDSDTEEENTLFDDTQAEETESKEDDVEKCGVKKSLDDENPDYLDATDIVTDMAKSLDELKSENEQLRKSLEEVQNSMIDVTKSFGDYLKTPNARTTIMQKSVQEGDVSCSGPSKRPTNADFDVLKSALVSAAKKGTIGLEEVQFYNAEFQKSMKGQKIDPKNWEKICTIVKENR